MFGLKKMAQIKTDKAAGVEENPEELDLVEKVKQYLKVTFGRPEGSLAMARWEGYSVWERISFLTLLLTASNCIFLAGMYLNAFFGLKKTVVISNLLLALIIASVPFVIWLRATDEKFWAYHRRKRLFFKLALMHGALILLQPLYSVVWKLMVPLIIGNVAVNAAMTRRMVVLLCYLAEGVLFAGASVLIYRVAEPILTSRKTWRAVELFKFQQIYDKRKNPESNYDLKIFTSLETGKPIVTKENDRFVQMEINGASGTGKTSSIFLNGIWGDMDTKFKNKEARKEAYLAMITEGRATLKGPLKEFSEDAVIPCGKSEKEREKNAEELKSIRERYPDCGMTVVAPNPDLNVHVIRMAQARGFQVNVLDPVTSYADWKCAREMAINPFYIPLGLSEDERVIRISQAASVFADVLIATNQNGGSSDVYFTDISLSVSSNVAAVVMLAKNIDNEQACMEDVHECISDFGNLESYMTTIENHFGIKIIVDDPKAKGENSSVEANGSGSKAEKKKINEEARKNPYYQQLLFVRQELLGPGREAMFSQARGLRNLLNKILQDPRISRKLSATTKTRLDFDKILAGNEITVVSTAVELGQSISTSFGIFFLLLHRTSVLRRPKATRTPHFLWVDECAQYVHPLFDDVIALYRQYRVAAVLTLQTLTQLEKHRETAYLKNVFLGAGTHCVFGRLAVEEMELYGKMAGTEWKDQEQKSETTNSVLSSNPTQTSSIRSTPTLMNNLEGSEMRHLDFQELTIFTIDNGRVLFGELARVFFLPDAAYDTMAGRTIDWESIVPEAFSQTQEPEKEEPAESRVYGYSDAILPTDRSGFITEETKEIGRIAQASAPQVEKEAESADKAEKKEEAQEENKKSKEEEEFDKLLAGCTDINEVYAMLSGESGKDQ